jgi:DNA-binding response OmpR family regulator
MSIMRRTDREVAVVAPVIRVGALAIDLLHCRARVNDHDLHLTPLELSLLFLLAANAGRVLTREEILNHVWGANDAAASNVVDCQIRTLRAKLQDDWRRPRYIATIPGQGYQFVLISEDQTTVPPS